MSIDGTEERQLIVQPAWHSATLIAMDAIWLILSFAGGLAAKPLADVFTEVAKHLVFKRMKRAELAETQADEAAKRCLEAIAVYADVGLRYMTSREAHDWDSPVANVLREPLRLAEVQLEASIALLQPAAMKPMTLVLDVLRNADQIDGSSGSPFAHYDSGGAILLEAVRYGRVVLRTQLRREKVPTVPLKMLEYAVALRDLTVFWEGDGIDPDVARVHQQFRATWLEAHHLGVKQIEKDYNG
ncbi:hypothetical protein [Flindersiella endophytica]